MEKKICKLCEREVRRISEHHIIPKSVGGKHTISICSDCHRQIHALFDNKTLGSELNTIEKLLLNESFYKYVKWVKKRPEGSVHKVRRSKATKRRGRRG